MQQQKQSQLLKVSRPKLRQKSDQTNKDEDEACPKLQSDELSFQKSSRKDFKMIFMNSSYSNRNLSNEIRIQTTLTPGFVSGHSSCRSLLTGRYTASLRKAISSMKIHSYKTDFHKSVSSVSNLRETNDMQENIGMKQVPWYQEFECVGSSIHPKDMVMCNKVIAQIQYDDTVNDIVALMYRGIGQFLYRLGCNSVENNATMWSRIDEGRLFVSKIRDVAIATSVIPEISNRTPMMGRLKRGLHSIVLKPAMKIIVTSDRRYASRCSKNVIYINCRHTILLHRPPDTIQIEDVVLRVKKVVNLSLECDVFMGGKLKSYAKVLLPAHARPDPLRVSCEELEDLSYLIANNVNCLMLPSPGNQEYLESIQNAAKLLGSTDMRILVKVKETEIVNKENGERIARNFDGILLTCQSCPCAQNLLADSTRTFIELCYQLKKPLILKCAFTEACMPVSSRKCELQDYVYFLFHFDSFFLTFYEAVPKFHLVHQSILPDQVEMLEQFAYRKLQEPFIDKSATGSDTMARVISKMTYDLNAKTILICSASGRMPIKISHFRPKCPIIVLTKNKDMINYLKTFYNIFIAYYQEIERKVKLARKNLLIARLLHGMVHGLSLQLFGHGDTIIFCFKNPADVAYANCIVPFRMDVEMAKKQIETLTVADGESIIKYKNDQVM